MQYSSFRFVDQDAAFCRTFRSVWYTHISSTVKCNYIYEYQVVLTTLCSGTPGYVLSDSVLETKRTLYFPLFHSTLCFCAVQRKAEHGVHVYLCPKTPMSRCCSSVKWTALCDALRSAAKQWKKEMKICRLSLPIASLHLLPEITTVHQAVFGPGPSPWFRRFAWLSRRQQPPPAPLTHQNSS